MTNGVAGFHSRDFDFDDDDDGEGVEVGSSVEGCERSGFGIMEPQKLGCRTRGTDR
jgi:hypothetical protein